MTTHHDLEIYVNSQEPCDLLHSHSWGPFYIKQGLRYRCRRVLTVHTLPETAEGALPLMNPLTRPLVRTYLRSVYNFSDVVIAVAPATASSLRRLEVRSRIEVIPNPIRNERFFASTELRREGRALLGLADERPLVLGVGQLQPRKGIADFAEVARRMPEAQFIWVGGQPFGVVSAGRSKLKRLMNYPPKNLRFKGPYELTQMPLVYNAADFMLFPSFQENCPYAPMEAASCGVPVIFRDLPEYRVLYPSEYIAASTVAGFRSRLQELLESPSRRKHEAQAGMRLSAHFQPAQYIEALARLYDEVACSATSNARPNSVQ